MTGGPAREPRREPGDADDFRQSALMGLAQPRKAIPAKYLYDAQGSALFDAICELPEYYLTRTEIAILRARAPEIARLAGLRAALVEFGGGSCVKARILLDALEAPAAYVPVDVSGEHLERAAAALAADYPGLPVAAVCADYMRPFRLPPAALRADKRVGFFPGSTIGNLRPEEARAFLGHAARLLGRTGGEMIVGVDLKKDPALLHAAYNDSCGVTAAFSLNLLARMNRELGADFDLARFAHDAFYNAGRGRIEIYLRSLAEQTVTVAGRRVRFAAGERLHTEYSYKYAPDEFRRLAAEAGFRALESWTDPAALFSVHYLRAAD
jgi:dimethylhistidine N-methyltransferase